MSANDSIFISAEELAEKMSLASENLVIFDASWYLPTMERNAFEEYQGAHIQGALFFDIDALSDHSTDLPHMLPSGFEFSGMMRQLGVSDQDEIIIYDNSPLYSSARARWTLKHFGAQNVKILEGGLRAWKEAGFEITSEPIPVRPEKTFFATLGDSVMDYQTLQAVIDSQSHLIIDARSAARFRGEAPEPRPNLSSGHMPSALNLPFQTLLNEEGMLKSKEELRSLFTQVGVEEDSHIVTSCGSGVTAAVLSLGLERIGHKDHRLYDGSWSEYASREESKIIKDI